MRARGLAWSLLGGAAPTGCGSLPPMGLPGAPAMVPATPPIGWWWGVGPEAMFPQGGACPFAIMVTLAPPLRGWGALSAASCPS